MSEQLNNIDFNLVRYANCWEDADVLLKALQVGPGARVLSIASAGDNSFSLAAQQPDTVVAADISLPQLWLMELKMTAIRRMTREQYLCFAGFRESETRETDYRLLRTEISGEARQFWDARIQDIRTGIIHSGKFERYFQLFRTQYLPEVHPQAEIDELLKAKPASEQEHFHDTVWHTDAWKKLYAFYFGEQMMGDKGRDPGFLCHVEGKVSDIILSREVQHLRTVAAQKNYFLHYILNNRFQEESLPHYVREEVYPTVQKNLHRITLFHGLLDDVLEQFPEFTHFNLSDIFEYMDVATFENTCRKLLSESAGQSRFAYWNLMVPRNMQVSFPEELSDDGTGNILKAEDHGYFYGSFHLNQKR